MAPERGKDEKSHQTIYTKYIDARKLAQFLDQLHGPGNYNMKIRRGMFHLELPSRLTPEQEAALKHASDKGSDLSLPDSQYPKEPAEEVLAVAQVVENAAPSAENLRQFSKLRRFVQMNWGDRVWRRLHRSSRKKGRKVVDNGAGSHALQSVLVSRTSTNRNFVGGL